MLARTRPLAGLVRRAPMLLRPATPSASLHRPLSVASVAPMAPPAAPVLPAVSGGSATEERSGPPTSPSCARTRAVEKPTTHLTPVADFLDTIRRQQGDAPLAPATPSPILTDRFGRTHNYLRISLTERCNLRCVYCMPPEGVELTPANSLLTTEEIQHILELFVRAGVNKLRLTGGEPTVRKDLESIIASAASLRPQGLGSIGITSNGLVLHRKLPGLIAAGLTHLNISLDTLDPLQFEILTRRPAAGWKLVRKAIDDAVASVARTDSLRAAAEAAGLSPDLEVPRGLRSVKINVVVIRGVNDREILDFVELTRELNVEVRFIEYMPFDGNRWKSAKMLPYTDILAMIKKKYPSLARLPAEANETAKTWQVQGHQGRVGFITSMSDHFCNTCNRLRITADGNLKVCLFGAHEVSLRDALREGRTKEEMGLIIGAAVQKKKAQHAGMSQLASQKNRPMITIGG